MIRQASSWMTASMANDRAGIRLLSKNDLRQENVRLRQSLKLAENIASRYTMMLREGDHRIKNSLQIVSSLMNLQAQREASETARDALRAAAARVQSIAGIHDALQVSGGEDWVDIGTILQIMCESLQSMAGDPDRIAIVVEAEPIQAPVALAQPIVLAINELVVNALRHAFPANRVGRIYIGVVRIADELRIVVADDGIGLPDGYADGRGYGMTLVRMMVNQVGGEFRVDSKAGATFSLSAPAPSAPVMARLDA
jgi:two-component system, sensor histidine kinase PdtaS